MGFENCQAKLGGLELLDSNRLKEGKAKDKSVRKDGMASNTLKDGIEEVHKKTTIGVLRATDKNFLDHLRMCLKNN